MLFNLKFNLWPRWHNFKLMIKADESNFDFVTRQMFANIYSHLITFNASFTFTFIVISVLPISSQLQSVQLINKALTDWLIDEIKPMLHMMIYTDHFRKQAFHVASPLSTVQCAGIGQSVIANVQTPGLNAEPELKLTVVKMHSATCKLHSSTKCVQQLHWSSSKRLQGLTITNFLDPTLVFKAKLQLRHASTASY